MFHKALSAPVVIASLFVASTCAASGPSPSTPREAETKTLAPYGQHTTGELIVASAFVETDDSDYQWDDDSDYGWDDDSDYGWDDDWGDGWDDDWDYGWDDDSDYGWDDDSDDGWDDD